MAAGDRSSQRAVDLRRLMYAGFRTSAQASQTCEAEYHRGPDLGHCCQPGEPRDIDARAGDETVLKLRQKCRQEMCVNEQRRASESHRDGSLGSSTMVSQHEQDCDYDEHPLTIPPTMTAVGDAAMPRRR